MHAFFSRDVKKPKFPETYANERIAVIYRIDTFFGMRFKFAMMCTYRADTHTMGGGGSPKFLNSITGIIDINKTRGTSREELKVSENNHPPTIAIRRRR